jgi:hypothetical protein
MEIDRIGEMMESMGKKGFLVQSDGVDHEECLETGNGWLEDETWTRPGK